MTAKTEKKRKCIGFGSYEGICTNEAGTPWTTYWCDRCDKLRREHITKQLAEIANGLRAAPPAGSVPGDAGTTRHGILP